MKAVKTLVLIFLKMTMFIGFSVHANESCIDQLVDFKLCNGESFNSAKKLGKEVKTRQDLKGFVFLNASSEEELDQTLDEGLNLFSSFGVMELTPDPEGMSPIPVGAVNLKLKHFISSRGIKLGITKNQFLKLLDVENKKCPHRWAKAQGENIFQMRVEVKPSTSTCGKRFFRASYGFEGGKLRSFGLGYTDSNLEF